MAAAVIVQPGKSTTVAAAGTPVEVIPVNPNGGIITNPLSAADQGNLEPDALAEFLYVNPIDDATTVAQGETFALAPGQSWVAIPGQVTRTTVNSRFAGHRFSAVHW